MLKQEYPALGFWLRQLILIIVVVAVAITILVLHERYKARPVPEGGKREQSIQSGLSDFYREYRNTFNELTLEEPSDFVLDVQLSDVPLEERLQSVSQNAKSVPSNWVGTYKNRSFRPGASLREAMTEYAKQDGVRLIWDLNQDFVVKHMFQMEGTVADALVAMGKAIDSNFEKSVIAYLCPDARTLVITTQQSETLDQQCQRLRSR